jgi:putative phosphoribosyl transferase
MMYGTRFASREEAGVALARRLAKETFVRPVILALPRGGIPIGLKCAQALKAPLDLLMVRKIGVPWQKELAAAAIVDGESHELVLNDNVMTMTGLDVSDLEGEIVEELAEIERRRKKYLQERPPIAVKDRSVIIVDDGIATGTTLRVAIKALRKRQPKEIVGAVPVAPADTIERLRSEVDRIFCLAQPEPFYAIGLHYVDFHPVSDEEVIRLMAQAPADSGTEDTTFAEKGQEHKPRPRKAG